MYRKFVVCLAMLAGASVHSAGIHQLAIAADSAAQKTLQALVWTPCAQPAQPLQLGPFSVQAVKDCPVAARDGQKLPLVVLSHGYGGSQLSHHNVATALADSGYFVLSLNHSLDSALSKDDGGILALEVRPNDVSKAISGLLQKIEFGSKIDATRIGFLGFSRGGYTGLVLAGAKPNFGQGLFECQDMRIKLCRQIRAVGTPSMMLPADPRIKAYVLADPLNAFPTRSSVYAVRAPIQLWASELGGDGIVPGSVQALAKLLPPTTELQVVAGAGHFAFLPPCTPSLAALAPEVCADPTGFDRGRFQARFVDAVRRYFDQKL